MRTITFYSYKGGVGRSLLVANTAKYLSTLGKSVFAMDLDLEAPGLHYKFELDPDIKRSGASPGVVDILSSFLKKRELPKSLTGYSSAIKVSEGSGPIQIMRAGIAPHGDYWRQLAQVNWYEILYGKEPVGVPFFLELKERIRDEFEPDFLLIDSRTGITEMGGIATTLLPDTVVCLALASVEHLEGLRAVMQGINQTALREESPIKLLTVISRLPVRREEDGELKTILDYLRTPIRPDVPRIDLEEVYTLHSEPILDTQVQLLIGGKNSPHELPLLRDYLRLFAKVVPTEDIRLHVGKLVEQAVSRLLDDPDAAQSELEALTAYCADQEAYRALIKLYQVRKVSFEKILATAALMWQMRESNAEPDQLILDVVRSAYSDPRNTEIHKKFAEFAESVWRLSGLKDIRTCMAIVDAYLPERRDRATGLLLHYVGTSNDPSPIAVVRLIDLLRGEEPSEAFDLVQKFKSSILVPEFHVAWVRLVLRLNEVELAKACLEDTCFRSDAVRALAPALMYRVLRLAEKETANDFLRESLESAASAENMSQLRDLSELFYLSGDVEELEYILSKWLRPNQVNEVLSGARRRRRRPRLPLHATIIEGSEV
jgi:CobQ/CobB/MinD/ParA nucleotide binding domain